MSKQTIRLSCQDIEEILHHAHWIAAKNGAQQQFMRERYPTYTFPGLMRALIANKCLAKSRSGDGELPHFSGYRVRTRLMEIEIPSTEIGDSVS